MTTLLDRIFLPFAGRTRPSLLAWLVKADAGFRQRVALSRLDAHILDDIGLTEADIARDAPRWDAPRHWTRH